MMNYIEELSRIAGLSVVGLLALVIVGMFHYLYLATDMSKAERKDKDNMLLRKSTYFAVTALFLSIASGVIVALVVVPLLR